MTIRCLSAIALAALVLCLSAAPAMGGSPSRSVMSDATAPLGTTSAQLRQDGRYLVLRLETERDWKAKALTTEQGPYLCAEFEPPTGRQARTEVCTAGADRSRRPRLRVYRLTPGGRKLSGAPLSARVRRPSDRSVEAHFSFARAGLRAGEQRWRVLQGAGPACPSTERGAPGCFDGPFAGGPAEIRVLRIRLVGCKARGSSYVRGAGGGRRLMALTFDDGPSGYTAAVMNVLRRHDAQATFFMIGNQIPGREELLRRMLREGNEPGNHSFNHSQSAGLGNLRATSQRIAGATGFTPCVFRAPGNAVSGPLIAAARSLGMTTVQWDVDPRDWAGAGSGSIYSHVVSRAHAGAIVVLHDGGGARGATVAALPGILRSLRARGYRLVTVSELLGYRGVYRAG